MEESAFLLLIDKYLEGRATPAEQQLVAEYLKRLETDGATPLNNEQQAKLKELMFNNIHKEIHALPHSKPKRAIPFKRAIYMAAASLILICSIALLLRPALKKGDGTAKSSLHKQEDIAPGRSAAILTLANGSKVILDNITEGEITSQEGIKITKTADGQLVYSIAPSTATANEQPSFNIIETPAGGQYQINLSDGSKVWLNAASSLKFPTAFVGNERAVVLDGEAYFEIAPNKSMPFKVQAATQEVEVLGTQFNINAYANESTIKTTLVEGSVKIADAASKHAQLLKPGQEAVNAKNGDIHLRAADIDQAISWKDGAFVFNDMDLRSIIRQLERWYNVDVDDSTIPNTNYTVHISRELSLSEVFSALEITGSVKFTVENNTIKIDSLTTR